MSAQAPLLQNQEARISMTNLCNYRCVFCHAEGLGDVTKELWKPDESKTIDAVNQALQLGCTDITLTGGEPLIMADLALRIIEFVYSKAPDVTVTVVSNGALLKEEWLKKASLNKILRMNISLHTVNPREYTLLTGQTKTGVEAIQEKLALLKKYNVPFKLNCVALKSLTKPGHIEKLCDFAEKAGAKALKILELLIMESNEVLFGDFLSLNTIEKELPEDFLFSRKHPRRREFNSPDRALTVELQKCRCMYGCNHCRTDKTANLNTCGEFWPCFEGSESSFKLNPEHSLYEAIINGEKVLTYLAEKYGDESPSLIKGIRLTQRKREVYFELNDVEGLQDLIEKSRKEGIMAFTEYFYKPGESSETETRITKIRCHEGDPLNASLILSDVWVESEGATCLNTTVFADEKPLPMKTSKEQIDMMLTHLKWQNSFDAEISGAEYITKDGNRFSITEVTGIGQILCVQCEKEGDISFARMIGNREGLKIIEIPFPDFLRAHLC